MVHRAHLHFARVCGTSLRRRRVFSAIALAAASVYVSALPPSSRCLSYVPVIMSCRSVSAFTRIAIISQPARQTSRAVCGTSPPETVSACSRAIGMSQNLLRSPLSSLMSHALHVHRDAVHSLEFSHSGRFLASGGEQLCKGGVAC